MKPIKLSAVIITFNEGRNIGRCLHSLQGIADEIIVVDSFSTDNTQEICESYSVRFVQRAFDGYISQKNHANQLATHDFILSIDADEEISPELRTSILFLKRNQTSDAYEMKRLTNYAGKWIRYCGWYPDKKVRIFNKNKAEWGHRNPHERLMLADGTKVETLKGDLLHFSYYSTDEHWERAEKYARMAAKTSIAEGKTTSVFLPYFSTIIAFFKVFILKKGFLDGKAGFKIAQISAWEKWLKYSLIRTNS